MGVIIHDRYSVGGAECPDISELSPGESDDYRTDEDFVSNFFESFEVVVDDVAGKVRVYHRTIRLKDEEELHLSDEENDENISPQGLTRQNNPQNFVVQEDFYEHEDSFMDSLLYGCVGCGVSGLVPRSEVKSILKSNKYTNNRIGNPRTKDPKAISMTHTVSFSSIDLKEFKMTLGDHPSAISGPPVRLDWNSKPLLESVVSLDEFEQMRKPLRRKRKQLKLTNHQRKEILLKEQGFTTDEVNKAWSEALKVRQQRFETLQRGVSAYQINMDHLVESFHRKCDRLATSTVQIIPASLTW